MKKLIRNFGNLLTAKERETGITVLEVILYAAAATVFIVCTMVLSRVIGFAAAFGTGAVVSLAVVGGVSAIRGD